jgi:hypothetical protein
VGGETADAEDVEISSDSMIHGSVTHGFIIGRRWEKKAVIEPRHVMQQLASEQGKRHPMSEVIL